MPSQLPYIICTSIVILLNAGPLVWQFKQGNSGPIAMGVWIMVGSINELVNTTVWYGDAIDRAPIWCDISVAIGQQIGRVASVYCIARFLAAIVDPRATAITRSDCQRRALHDYSVSFGVPAIMMACSVLYQPYRYRIVHGLGCTVPASLCWPVLVLRVIWSPVFAVGGMLYSAYTVYRLILHRRDLRRVVAGSHSALTTTRFMRLTALCIAYLCIGIPLAFVSAYQYISTAGIYADYSWAYMRSGWSVYGIPTSDVLSVADFSNWSNVVVASVFFAVFGFGGESSAALRKVGNMVRRPKMKPARLAGADRRTDATICRYVGVSLRKRMRDSCRFPLTERQNSDAWSRA
ncbi:fungal pheromone STE3G-protein-coupled receptor [Rhodotorula sp. JG-1b]|nr:fungal pheromone STE3G-protein-coupled receptor [Rhodotorula sp. JG-1b]